MIGRIAGLEWRRARRLASACLLGGLLAGCGHMTSMRHAGMAMTGGGGGCCCGAMMGGHSQHAMPGGAAPARMQAAPAAAPSAMMAPAPGDRAAGRFVPPLQTAAAAGPMCGADGGSCSGCACCGAMTGAATTKP